MYLFSLLLKRLLQLLSWLETCREASPHAARTTVHLHHSSTPSSHQHTHTHTHTYFTLSLFNVKAAQKLLAVGPHLRRADGCISAPHGPPRSGDEGSSLRRKRLSICFRNCGSSSSSSSQPPPPSPTPPRASAAANLTPCIHLAAADDNVNT